MLVLVLAITPMCAQVDVLTRRNDNFRSGVNAQETILTHASFRNGFGKLWTLYANAKIMAQPLYVSIARASSESFPSSNSSSASSISLPFGLPPGLPLCPGFRCFKFSRRPATVSPLF